LKLQLLKFKIKPNFEIFDLCEQIRGGLGEMSDSDRTSCCAVLYFVVCAVPNLNEFQYMQVLNVDWFSAGWLMQQLVW